MAVPVVVHPFSAVAVMLKVTIIFEPVVLVMVPEIFPLPDAGNAVLIPAGLSLVQLITVPATLFGLLNTIFVRALP